MANYTPNYRLHQWLPEDKFLRTDFNEAFAAIDAALGKTERDARRAVAGLERQGSDLYNLLLQNDYEGKTTGWKRALVFDGFQDGAGIAQKDEALILGRNCLSLHRTGLSSIDLGYGGDGSYRMSARITCTSGGRAAGFRLRLCNTGTVIDTTRVKTSLTRNGAVCFSGRETTGSYLPEKETEELEISFPASYEVKEGDQLELTAEIASKNWSLTHSAKSGNQLGGIFRFTPNGAERGAMTSISRPMPEAEGILAWVRHTGGTVFPHLLLGGTSIPLSPDGQRATVEPRDGLPCVESAFRLDRSLPGGESAVRLELACGGDPYLHVYDYGLMWIG